MVYSIKFIVGCKLDDIEAVYCSDGDKRNMQSGTTMILMCGIVSVTVLGLFVVVCGWALLGTLADIWRKHQSQRHTCTYSTQDEPSPNIKTVDIMWKQYADNSTDTYL